MQHLIYNDYLSLSEAVAQQIAICVGQKPNAVLCLASGSSPEGVFRALVKMSQDNEIDLSKAIFVGLDEWVGISPQNTGSCWHSVNANLFEPLNINPQNIIFFDALLPDLQAECQRVDALVSQLGGFDLMLLGIGLNGHIAMNEPGTSWHLYSHVVALHEMTKTVGQKYFKDQTTLSQGITLGLRYVSEAKLAILMANGSHKIEVINKAINQPISEDFPATIFQTFANGLVMTSPE